MAKDTSQVGVRLSGDVLKKLQRDPDGVSEAIRKRLAWTFELEKYDKASRDLLNAVLYLSRQVRLHTGIPWNENEGVRRTLVAAIDAYTEEEMRWPVEDEWDAEVPKSADRNDPENWLPFSSDPQKLGLQLGMAYVRLMRETAEEDDETDPR
jgi:hypothetical protein